MFFSFMGGGGETKVKRNKQKDRRKENGEREKRPTTKESSRIELGIQVERKGEDVKGKRERRRRTHGETWECEEGRGSGCTASKQEPVCFLFCLRGA